MHVHDKMHTWHAWMFSFPPGPETSRVLSLVSANQGSWGRRWREAFCQRWVLGQCVKECFRFWSTTDFGKSSTQSYFKRLWLFRQFVCDGLRLARIADQDVFKAWSLLQQMCWPHKGRWPYTTVFIFVRTVFQNVSVLFLQKSLNNAGCFFFLVFIITKHIVHFEQLELKNLKKTLTVQRL